MTVESNLVESWYDARAELEEHRLDEGRLEFEVTMRTIESLLSEPGLGQAKVLDIGGGPGKYAIALASRGHRVTLSDLSGKSLDIARRNAEKGTVQLDAIIHANALDIAQHSLLISSIGTFDMVLCLGPLYHLVVSEERASVIRNCISMAKPGGYILLAYVTVYAHLRNLAKRDPSRLANEWSFYEEYMNSGKYTRNPETRSFHIHHAKLQQELFAFGGQVTLEKVLSCEGFLGSSGGIGLATLSETDMKRWIDVVMRTADHTETLNSADHLLVILRRVNTCRAS